MQFPGVQYDVAVDSLDPEFFLFLECIKPALAKALWKEVEWSIGGIFRMPNGRVLGCMPSAVGISIGVCFDAPAPGTPSAVPAGMTLVAALKEEGIEATAIAMPRAPNTIHIMIGRKTESLLTFASSLTG
jgi:hypothetical protein